MFCSNCGSELPEGVTTCPDCGYSTVSGGAALSIEIMKRAFQAILKKPFKLWGISLLCGLLSVVAYILGGPVIAIGFAVSLVLNLGMEWIYLDGLRGEEVSTDKLFVPFKNFWKSFAGMGWRELWLFLWALIPFAGIVFAIIKTYSYLLTPFILREKDDVSAQEALKESMRRTDGYKGSMFLADLFVALIIAIPALILVLLSLIPFVGLLFVFLSVLFWIVVGALLPLYQGLVRAAWYEEIGQHEE